MNLELGEILNTGATFKMNANRLLRNMLVCGTTGSGKTNMLMTIISQLVGKIPILVFSLNREYRPLLCQFRDNVYIFRWEWLRINPFASPPGISYNLWFNALCHILGQSMGLLIASEGFLLSCFNKLLYHAQKLGQETFRLIDVIDYLSTIKFPQISRDARYLEASLNRLMALYLAYGDTLDCINGYNIIDLLESNACVIIEIDFLLPEHRIFIEYLILASLFYYALSRLESVENEQIRLLIVLDEAQEIFHKHQEQRIEEGPSFAGEMMSQFRKTGTSILMSTQTPSQIMSVALANTDTKIVLRQVSGVEISILSQALRLNKEQTDFIKKLVPGQGIVQGSFWPEPFVVQFFYNDFGQTISNSELEERMLPIIKSLEYKKGKSLFQSQNVPPHGIRSEEKAFLMDVYNHPLIPIKRRIEQLRLSTNAGVRIKNALLKAGYIKEIEFSTGRRGSSFILLEITKTGMELLGLQAEEGQGNTIHRSLQRKIAEIGKTQGFKVEIEGSLNGKRTDVIWITDNGVIAHEIALSIDRQLNNIKRNIEAEFTLVKVWCRTTEILTALEEIVRKELNFGEDKIQFSLISHIFQEVTIDSQTTINEN